MADKYTYSFDELKPGTILVCEWGYSMNIVDFYKVIGTRGKATVILQKLYNKTTEGDGWSGKCIPSNGPKGDPIIARLSSKSNCIKLSSCRYLQIWDGESAYYNHLD